MKFSIIIPVYNAIEFLNASVQSVLSQSYADFELILVDDGSTDGSEKICDEYAKLDPRVRSFHKINGGVSSARNIGLENINGEWILFLDADDMLHPSTLECLNVHIKQNGRISLIQFALTRSSFTVCETPYSIENLKCLSPIEYSKSGVYNVCAGGNAIKAQVVNDNNIRFDCEMKLAEDQVFVFRVMEKSDLCLMLPHELYYYRNNSTSATNTAKIWDMVQTIRSLEKYKNEISLGIRQFNTVIMSFIYYIILTPSCDKSLPQNLLNEVSVKSIRGGTRGVKLLFFLSRISNPFAINIIRNLKKFF